MNTEDQRKLQLELFSIINKYFAGENERLAYVLKQLGKPVSVRTIQAWLIDPERQSSRKVPDWLLPTLRSIVSKENEHSVHSVLERTGAYAVLSGIVDRSSVIMADRQIERNTAIKEKWMNAPLSDLPELMAELEMRVEQQDEFFGMLSDSIREAVDASDDFATFKREFKERREVGFRIFNEVRRTRMDIQAGNNEFANDEGLTED